MSWTQGSTRAWRRVRAYVLHRDGNRCRAHADGYCARASARGVHVCTGRATHAHHVLGRSRTGDDPRYLVAACEACNLFIGDPAATADPALTAITDWKAQP